MADREPPKDEWCPVHDLWHLPGPCPDCEAGEPPDEWAEQDRAGLGPVAPDYDQLREWEREQEARAAWEAACDRGGMVPLAWLTPGVN